MQNKDFDKGVSWNPWHGCHKVSPGCKNCYVYAMDQRYGRDATKVAKGKTTFQLKNVPYGSLVTLCFSSDFFIEEADEWRDYCWDDMRRRPDCIFYMTTKRPERILQCLPSDWGDGWEHVYLNVSVENQEMADKRIPLLLEAPILHREILLEPLIEFISLHEYLGTGKIQQVTVGGENTSYSEVRPMYYDWVKNVYLQCLHHGVEFCFHQTGTYFVKGDTNLGAWQHKRQKINAESIQRELEQQYGKTY